MKNQKYPYTDMYGREIRLLKEGIEHQGIGGQEFAIDEQVTQTLTNEEVFKYKLYYGKVNNLGYIVAEDEFEVR